MANPRRTADRDKWWIISLPCFILEQGVDTQIQRCHDCWLMMMTWLKLKVSTSAKERFGAHHQGFQIWQPLPVNSGPVPSTPPPPPTKPFVLCVRSGRYLKAGVSNASFEPSRRGYSHNYSNPYFIISFGRTLITW
jgi:hypothetical protein